MSSGYPVQTNITPLPPAPGLPPTQSASHPSLQYANPGMGIGMNGAGSGGLLGSQSAPAGLFPQLGHGSFGMDLGGGGHPPTLRAMSFPGSQGHSQAGSASPFTPQQSSGPTYQQRQSAAAAAMAMELLGQATGAGPDGGGGQGGLSSFDWPVHGGGQPNPQDGSPYSLSQLSMFAHDAFLQEGHNRAQTGAATGSTSSPAPVRHKATPSVPPRSSQAHGPRSRISAVSRAPLAASQCPSPSLYRNRNHRHPVRARSAHGRTMR